MQLKAEQVQRCYLLMAGIALPIVEAETRAKLLEVREELLAVLLLREEMLSRWPEAATVLQNIAVQNYVKPNNSRPAHEDCVRRERLHQATTSALERLVAAESQRSGLTSEAHAALQQYVLAWRDMANHPGYHYCIGHEPEVG